MKIITCGMSPNIFLANGKINSYLLQHLYKNKHSVATLSWAHDTSIFVPEEKDGQKNFYYEFKLDEKIHKIPLIPFNRNNKESVFIYEILKEFKPDLFIMIGDISEHLYVKALKMFCSTDIKWMSVVTNYQYPINPEHIDVINELDSILCTSKSAFNSIKPLVNKPHIDWCFFGSDLEPNMDVPIDEHKLTTIGKNSQSDNLFAAMQISDLTYKEVPHKLYLHANIYDHGEINLENLKKNCKNKEIYFPEKYISLFDGLAEKEFSDMLSSSSVYLDTSMVSGTSCCAFDAIACGCVPLMTDSPCNRDLAEILAKILRKNIPQFTAENFLINSIKIVTIGETYLNICNPEDAKKKIIHLLSISKGIRKDLIEFSKKYRTGRFLGRAMKLIDSLDKNLALWLE